MAYNVPRTYVLLASSSSAGLSNVPFTSLITANFSTYYVKFRNIIPVTNGVTLLMTLSTDNGGTYLSSNYQWVNRFQIIGSDGRTNSNSDSSITLASVMRNATPGMNGDMYLFNMNSSTYSPSAQVNIAQAFQSDSGTGLGIVTGYNTTTTAITAVKFTLSGGGNFTSGIIDFYGIGES